MKRLLLLLSIISSCNSNENINAKIQSVVDSTQQATRLEDSIKIINSKKAEAERIKKAKDKKQRNTDLDYAKQMLNDLEAQLIVDNDQLDHAKSFHLIRTNTEKEHQMLRAIHKIQDDTTKITFFKTAIKNIQSGNTYDIFPTDENQMIYDSTKQ